jgi:hypothetical protein
MRVILDAVDGNRLQRATESRHELFTVANAQSNIASVWQR